MLTKTEIFDRLLQAGFPAELARYKMRGDSLPQSIAGRASRILDTLATASADAPTVIYLAGPVHVGKSSLAVRLAWTQIAVSNASVAWLTPWRLRAEMSNNYGYPATDYAKPDLLVVDDIAMADARVAAVYSDILMARYERGCGTTIITSNRSLPDLGQIIAQALGDVTAEKIAVRLTRGIRNGAALDFTDLPTQGLD